MAWKLAADFVVLIHLLWIVFIIGGALIGRRVRWIKWVHIAALTFSIPLQVFGWVCPLTFLENWLRHRHHPSLSYSGDFIAQYADRLVYLQAPRSVIFVITLIIVALSAWAYWPRQRAPSL